MLGPRTWEEFIWILSAATTPSNTHINTHSISSSTSAFSICPPLSLSPTLPPSFCLLAGHKCVPSFSTQKWGKVVKLIKKRGCGSSTDVHWDGRYWVAGIMACGPGGQRGCVGGSSYLGVHVNQRACLLRAGELRGKGSVSPASSEETRLASWLRAQICQFGQTGRYAYEGGKGQEKCVLINSAGCGGTL